MTPLGEGIGVQIAKIRYIALILMIGFIMGRSSRSRSRIYRYWQSRSRLSPTIS